MIFKALSSTNAVGFCRRIPSHKGYVLSNRNHICLDKGAALWSTEKLINFSRGLEDEKDIDEFQQYEDEAHPRIPRPNGHQGRPGRPQ
jgi:hypothetical protein